MATKLKEICFKNDIPNKEVVFIIDKQNKVGVDGGHFSRIKQKPNNITIDTCLKICRALSYILSYRKKQPTIITPNDIIEYETILNPKIFKFDEQH
jgi:DNA-binding Xre family transcriptional regulator